MLSHESSIVGVEIRMLVRYVKIRRTEISISARFFRFVLVPCVCCCGDSAALRVLCGTTEYVHPPLAELSTMSAPLIKTESSDINSFFTKLLRSNRLSSLS